MVRVALHRERTSRQVADGTAIPSCGASRPTLARFGDEGEGPRNRGLRSPLRSVDSSTSGTHRGTRIEIMAQRPIPARTLARAGASIEQLAAVPVGAS